MKRIEIFDGNWSLELVQNNKNKIYIFGDNDLRQGQGGQATIRSAKNSFGIRTKKKPTNDSDAYYTDKELEENKQKILQDILSIKLKWLEGQTIVLSKNGYGTGLAMLKEMAPLTFDFLCVCLKNILGFDNLTGRKWSILPSITDIENGNYVLYTKQNSDIFLPVNNSFFIDDLLKSNINNYFDAIVKERKISITSKKSYNSGEIILLSFFDREEYLVVRVLCDSFQIQDLNIWSKFEGVKSDFLSVNFNDYNQTLFSYVCQLNQDGKMIIKDEYFSDLPSESENLQTVDTNIEEKSEVTNDIIMIEILKQLKEITKKLDNLGGNEK